MNCEKYKLICVRFIFIFENFCFRIFLIIVFSSLILILKKFSFYFIKIILQQKDIKKNSIFIFQKR